MALSKNFDRPKLATTLVEALSLSAAIADGGDGNTFVVDITTNVTQDDTDVVPKTLARIIITPGISGSSMTVTMQPYTFNGDAADYSAGGIVPSLSVATKGNVVDLDAFFTAAGDTRKNS